ncbi:MAG: flagellar protein FlgN [Firmicutes bacterium]|mgnify:CR=1 FL=1|nr:flagellar protein FlgN [Bacillota bacterium]
METLNKGRLIDLLSRKLNLLNEVLAYSEEQRKLSYQDNPSKIDNLIESRAKCLEDLDKLEVVLKRSLNQMTEDCTDESGFCEKLIGLKNNIRNTLKQIIEVEKENKAKLLQERSRLQSKLQNVNQGRKGVAGYKANKGYSASGIFTDNKG